ncbi:MAG: hypothetical protein IT443_10730 [Phycisphaeraceae bacterium]|nr:hypothetical protein [Phycisphaeraceae bacterium]
MTQEQEKQGVCGRGRAWRFAMALLLFFAVGGGLAMFKPLMLWVAAGIGASLAVLGVLTTTEKNSQPYPALLVPLILAVAAEWSQRVERPIGVAAVLWAAGVGLALAVAAWPRFGESLREIWQRGGEPVGQGVTVVVLAVVYYGVVTPIGLAMRMVGYDPMRRRSDKQAKTYWMARPAAPQRERYLRQS